MNEVKRAIIMAAGLGNRMRPLTNTVPKPLIKIKGKPIIEGLIEILINNGISDIHIVTGYLKAQFEYLKEKYGVKLIENPYYLICNNISSLYVARHLLDENVMILDGDQIINNPDCLTTKFDKSGYNAVWTSEKTNEWLMAVSEGIVVSCSRTGGTNGWQLFSVSRWAKKDGEKLRKHLEIEFEQNNNRQIYWDDIAMFCYPEEYTLGIHEMEKNDVIEVDSIQDLVRVDDSYLKLLKEVEN